MERRKFFSLLGAGAAAVVVSKTLTSCSKSIASPYGAPQNLDFTLDLTNTAYAGLKNKGGSAYNSGLIIAHTSSDTFVALSEVCTHQGCTVQFNGSNGFVCPCHNSTFALDGSVTGGPAPTALAKYNTLLTGTSLRVYS
jgi:cytochrome b6-f complex iron-sulfur subunit